MKNNKLVALFLLITLSAAIFSCERADELSQSDILSVQWIVNEVLIDGAKDDNTDYSGHIFTFNKDLTYNFTKSPVSKIELQGSWILSEDNQFLYLTGKSFGEQAEVPIFTLDEDNATLKFTIPATFKSPEKECVYVLVRK